MSGFIAAVRRDRQLLQTKHSNSIITFYFILLTFPFRWRRSTVVERWSFTGELSLSCA